MKNSRLSIKRALTLAFAMLIILFSLTKAQEERKTLPLLRTASASYLGPFSILQINLNTGQASPIDPKWIVNNGPAYTTSLFPGWTNLLAPAQWIQPINSPTTSVLYNHNFSPLSLLKTSLAGSTDPEWQSARHALPETDERVGVFVPIASFTFSPLTPNVGQPVQFTSTSTGVLLSQSWDLDGNGTIDATSPTTTYTFTSSGLHKVTLNVSNPFGKDIVRKYVYVNQPGNTPRVTDLIPTYDGYFLRGANFNNNYNVRVDWKGAPGTVKFTLNNGAPIITPGNTSGASRAFNLNTDFTPSWAPTALNITPTNGAAVEGTATREYVYVFPYPNWLQRAVEQDPNALKFSAGNGEIKANINFDYPQPHLVGIINIPQFVPFLGGRFGLSETFATIKGSVSSKGHGKFLVKGQIGFEAMGQELKKPITGSGTFLLDPSGLSIQNGTFNFNLSGTLRKEIGIVEAIPGLANFNHIAIIRWFNQRARLIGEISPTLSLSTNFAQDQNRVLPFKPASGTVGLHLKGTLLINLTKNINARGWVAGGGNITVGTPAPFLRGMSLVLEAGAQLKYNWFFQPHNLVARIVYRCTWSSSAGTRCTLSSLAPDSLLQQTEMKDERLFLIQPNYRSFGAYSVFQPSANEIMPVNKPASSEIPQTTQASTVVSNVFPGATPQFTKAGNGSLLIWVHQNPVLPVLQSTDIRWAFRDGSGWSVPASVAVDTRAEISPVTGVDSNGKVVAVWTRIKDPNFTTPIPTITDLPLYYTKFEVVSAVFDPATRTWSAVTPLTNDESFDGSLCLSSDSAGHLLLTWLSNAGGQFTSSAASPSVLKYSIWVGSNWSAPAIFTGGLVGVSNHVAALQGSSGFIILPRDPDPTVSGDGTLDLYNWNGLTWSFATTFAAGGVENRLPSVAYDSSGNGQVLWLREDDLVRATLSNPTPEIVRAGSSSMSFYGATLLNNPQGMLTLIWQEVIDNGPANIFGMLFDPTTQTWSKDRRLNEGPLLAHDVAGYYGNDGKLHLAYLDTEILRTSRTVVIDGETVTIPNIPEEGRTDLQVLERSLVADLSVTNSDLSLNVTAPEPREVVQAMLNLRNAGDFPVSSFNVNLYAGDPADGGVLLGSSRINGLFVAGDQRTLTFAFLYPERGGDIVAVIDAQQEIAEFTEDNNRATVFLDNTAPNVFVWADVTSGALPLAVNFGAAASYDIEGDAMDFIWTFADGSPSANGLLVSHTFTEPGLYPVTVTATDSRGAVAIGQVYINAGCAPLNFSPPSVPAGDVGRAYNHTISANGGIAPYSYAVTLGELPPGLILSPSGTLSGVPTLAGIYNFTISVTYANGCPGSLSNILVIHQPRLTKPSDFDGDGKTDIAVFRPADSHWYMTQSSNNLFRAEAFGSVWDVIVPGDYDGDRKTDTAVFRPTDRVWYIRNSSNGALRATPFGTSGDVPTPGDYDGDGKTDISVFRPSTGTFYILYSSNGSFHAQQWGQNGDVPVIGDYDGDGKTEFAVFRTNVANIACTFYMRESSSGIIRAQNFGIPGDQPIAGDFDGDGRTDIAVFRSSAKTWYILQSLTNSVRGMTWGTSGDVLAPGDYDGDGKWDIAIFRSSTGSFYILQSTNNSVRAEQFGANGDVPVPCAYGFAQIFRNAAY